LCLHLRTLRGTKHTNISLTNGVIDYVLVHASVEYHFSSSTLQSNTQVHDGIHHVPPATLKQAGSTLLAFLQEVGTPGSSFGAKATAATAAAASSTSHSSTTASSSTPAGGIDSSRCSVSSPPLPPYLFELPPVDNGAVFFDFLHSW